MNIELLQIYKLLPKSGTVSVNGLLCAWYVDNNTLLFRGKYENSAIHLRDIVHTEQLGSYVFIYISGIGYDSVTPLIMVLPIADKLPSKRHIEDYVLFHDTVWQQMAVE